MNPAHRTLHILLRVLIVYFCAMAIAHFIDFKVPLLFIYYDVPSFAYQNQIISFCTMGYAAFAWAALRNFAAVPPFLVAMYSIVLGLSCVNLSASLRGFIGDASTLPYWLQTGLIATLVVFMTLLYFQTRNGTNRKNNPQEEQ